LKRSHPYAGGSLLLMSDSIRTFIAIELPDHIIASIIKVQQYLKSKTSNIKWVIPENIHLTLRFLGDIKPDDVQPVGQALSKAVKDVSPFSISAEGIGAFPGLNRPRVIWIGVGGRTDSLMALDQNLGDYLETIGFPREKRKFTGHLTIGRIRGKINPIQLIDAIKGCGGFKTELFSVNQVILFKSDLKPAGAVYKKLYISDL